MFLIKKIVLAFYNSFLKIELNCDKENITTLTVQIWTAKCYFNKE